MPKSKLVDIFKTKVYNIFAKPTKAVFNMDNFMQTKFNAYDLAPYYIYVTKNGPNPTNALKKHTLCINLNGYSKTIFSDGKVIESKPGIISFFPKNSSYHSEIIKPFDNFAISFSLVNDIDLKPFAFDTKSDPVIIERFKSALNAWNAKKPGYEEKVAIELYHIIRTMKQRYSSEYLPTEKYNILKPAIEYIHANYKSKRIKVEELAKICRISNEYFRAIFKSLYGYSPLEYIQSLQIASAKELLDSGEHTIHQISEMLGFMETGKFSRKFKKMTGVSPTDYIKNKKT